MELYLNIIKLFLVGETYFKYDKYIDKEYIKKNYPELYKLFKSLDKLHEDGNSEAQYSIVDVEATLYALYPKSDNEIFTPLFTRVNAASAIPKSIESYLQATRARVAATSLAFAALDFADGKITEDQLHDQTQTYLSYGKDRAIIQDDDFEDDDFEALYSKAIGTGGLRWRLKSLNRSLGPLRKGDFGFIFARPESGKTTFLASEVTYFAEQCTGNVLWFNNEEQNEKVLIRCYEASLGQPMVNLEKNKIEAREKFYARTGRRIKLANATKMDRRAIEACIDRHEPSLIVFDQLDKVYGFDADREDLKLGAVYQWAREIAKSSAPVIGVSQADGSGEGVKWLNMGHVANAKTAKQAEADWILGIGISYSDMPNVRGLAISKNKLMGGEETRADMRHSKWEVLLEPEIGRYSDIYME